MLRSVVHLASIDAQFTTKGMFLQAKSKVKIDWPGSHLLPLGRGQGNNMA
jgi:hypothetical protein